jgi:hypothetical protein
MRAPGFTAEASLRPLNIHYGGRQRRHSRMEGILLAKDCMCVDQCLQGKVAGGAACSSVPFPWNIACAAAVELAYAKCRDQCPESRGGPDC